MDEDCKHYAKCMKLNEVIDQTHPMLNMMTIKLSPKPRNSKMSFCCFDVTWEARLFRLPRLHRLHGPYSPFPVKHP